MDDRLEFHAPFLEEAVRAAVAAHPDASLYHRERETLYEDPDPARRERGFARLAATWFRRLRLDAQIHEALARHPEVLSRVARVLIGPAPRARDEGADLLVPVEGPPTLLIRIQPRTCARPASMDPLLRRELLHVADMLDPEFHYQPRLPPQPAGPAQDRLLQERYRVLWDCSVDGRLVRAGLLPEEVRQRRWAEFVQAFGGPGKDADDRFAATFDGARPSHTVLVALASERGHPGKPAAESRTAGRCTLCAFPTPMPVEDPAALPEEVRAAIGADFPDWQPGHPLCGQCADLYAARAALTSGTPGPAPAPEESP